MTARRQLRVIWRHRWWLVLLASGAAVAAFFVSRAFPSIYRAEALVQVVPAQQSDGAIAGQEELLGLTNVYGELANSTGVIERAWRQVDGGPYDEFRERVEAAPQEELGVIQFSADATDARSAAAAANAHVAGFAGYLEEVQRSRRQQRLAPLDARIETLKRELRATSNEQSASALRSELTVLQTEAARESLTSGDTVRIFENAMPPETPISPQPLRDALLALLCALIVGAAFVYARFAFANRYESAEEACADLGLPLLGEVPRASGEDASVVEALRIVRASVDFALRKRAADDERVPERERLTESSRAGIERSRLQRAGSDSVTLDGRILLVTSAEKGSGKSFVTARLARAFAVEGRRIVALDGDLRRPALHRELDAPLELGLSDLLTSPGAMRDDVAEYLAKDVSLPEAALQRGGELQVVTAGVPIEDLAETLSSPRMAQAVAALSRAYELVLVDTPPALAVADAFILTRYCDGVVIVVDSQRTKRRAAHRAVESLRALGVPLLGTVYNGAPRSDLGAYYPPQPAAAGRGDRVPASR